MTEDRHTWLIMPEHFEDLNDKELIDCYRLAQESGDERAANMILAEKLKRMESKPRWKQLFNRYAGREMFK